MKRPEPNLRRGQHRLRRLGARALLLAWAGLVCASAGRAAPAPASPAVKASETNAAAIPLVEVAPRAEAAFASLRAIEDSLAADQATAQIQEEMPALAAEATARLEESTRTLASSPSLGSLRRQQEEWQAVAAELADWKRSLQKRSTQLEEDRERLLQLQQVWQATQASLLASNVPPDVRAQAERVLAAVEHTQGEAQAQHMVVLSLRTRAAELDGRTRHTLHMIERAREAFLRRLLVRDAPPLWSPELWADSAQRIAEQSQQSWSRQVQALQSYIARKRGSLVLEAALFLLIFLSLIGARRILHRLGGDEAAEAARVFECPVATALAVALLASSWIYPQAPRLFMAITGAAAMVPTLLVVRRLIDPRLIGVLNALVLFYFVDQLRVVASSQAILSRLLLMAEMLGAVLFVGWRLRSGRLAVGSPGDRLGRFMVRAFWVTLVWFSLAFLASAVGYVTLSKLLGHALLQSAYLALVLYALVRIVDGLFLSALSVPPLVRLGVVKRHQGVLRRRLQSAVGWAAALLWASYVLEALSLRAPVFQNLREVLAARWTVGSFTISPGEVVLFGLTVWASFLISRLLRFVLEEEVYARVKLAPGLYYSISKMVNYAVLLVGFLIGLAMLNFDLTKLTILIGAFGVGLGFGLQNIINNFVSGLILLFERPIKVGDIIQLGANEGTVQRIGIRASIVRSANGAEFIVPNGTLLSETVTNWTYSDRLRRIDLPVVVAGTVEARRVVELLQAVAAEQPQVLKDPPPQVLLGGFAGDSLSLELRVWISQTDAWAQVRSALALAVRAALAAQNIALK